MYCPNCGSENSQEQRFCSKCGLHLQTIAQVVVHQLNAAQQNRADSDIPVNSKSIWQNPLLYGFFLLVLGLLTIALGKKVIGEQLVADIGSVVALVGVVFFVLQGRFLLQGLHELRGLLLSSPITKPTRADTTTELQPLLEAKEQPSVTEFTTRHLEHVYAERNDSETSTSRRHSGS